ncbi:MAG TPA: hypothetical protein PLV96_01665, partial [Methanoregulaceae archaeon]|nr:hypothetical protein [Methanoregulaceae archaeon]
GKAGLTPVSQLTQPTSLLHGGEGQYLPHRESAQQRSGEVPSPGDAIPACPFDLFCSIPIDGSFALVSSGNPRPRRHGQRAAWQKKNG